MILSGLKYMFVDLDGTALCSKKNISSELLASLKKLKCNHMEIFIVTGRSPGDSLQFYRLLELETYMVNFNGNMVWNPRTHEILYTNFFESSNKILRYIINNYSQFEIKSIALSSNLSNVFGGNNDSKLIELLSDKEIENKYIDIHSLKNIKNIQRIILSINPENKPVCIASLSKIFPNIDIFEWTDRHDIVDINIKNSSKWNAICRIINKIGGDLDKTICFGDSRTDLDMIIGAAVGVAMKNSDMNILQFADYITERDNNHNGLNHFIESYLL